MNTQYYRTPFDYRNVDLALMDSQALAQDKLTEMLQQQLLSEIDYDIIRLLFEHGYMNRNLLERYLLQLHPERKKGAKLNLKRLVNYHVIWQFRYPEGSFPDEHFMYFYCLAPTTYDFCRRKGMETVYERPNASHLLPTPSILSIMAYEQFLFCFASSCLEIESNYKKGFLDYTLHMDGRILLLTKERPVRAYVRVLRRTGEDGLLDAITSFQKLAAPGDMLLLLCEDISHIESCIVSMPAIDFPCYYTYDVACARGDISLAFIQGERSSQDDRYTLQYVSFF